MKNTLRRVLPSLALTLAVATATPGLLVPLTMTAQVRGPVQRTVQGKVQDKGGAAVKGAVVYLKDTHSSAVKSAISTEDGSYRFVQLSQNTDYELYAKSGDKSSKSKSISSFDNKNSFNIDLKIE